MNRTHVAAKVFSLKRKGMAFLDKDVTLFRKAGGKYRIFVDGQRYDSISASEAVNIICTAKGW